MCQFKNIADYVDKQTSASTVTMSLDKWNELRSYILKAASLSALGVQSDFPDSRLLENFLWALNDYIYNAEKLVVTINMAE